MTENYADIIFFAVVAIYLGLKLFSTLGKKNDNDSNLESRRAALGNNNILGSKDVKLIPAVVSKQPEVVVKNNLENFTFANDNAKAGIKEIIEKDPAFSIEGFFEGAKIAFEMLLKAYSENDRKTLKDLLSDEVYADMERHIENNKAQNHQVTKSLVAIEKVEVESAEISGSRIRIGLKFLTEQINVTKDANGNIIEGNARAIIVVEDNWVFERNTRSSNPNWTIVAL